MTAQDALALLPEAALLAAAVGGLLVGLWTPQRAQRRVAWIAVVGCLVSAAAAAAVLGDPVRTVFSGTWTVDATTGVVRLAVAAATAAVVVLLRTELAGHPRETEAYVLTLLVALGADALAATTDALLLVAAYLLASVPAYTLTAFRKDARGTEAALKYYLLSALVGVVLLVGAAALVLGTGRTGYAAVSASLPAAAPAVAALAALGLLAAVLFKAGAVPVHFWVPDAVDGASPAVAALISTVPKIGAVAAAFRLVAGPFAETPAGLALGVALVAAASMTLGNLAAFWQTSLQRLLAYSTISQVGYLLMIVAVAGTVELAAPALRLYLAAYAVTNIGAFAAVAVVPRRTTLVGWAAGVTGRPWLLVSLVVCLLGLVGTPPTAVFLGKLGAFTTAADGGYAWLVVLAAVNSVASLFYYLRWVAPAFRAVTSTRPRRGTVPRPAVVVLHTAAATSLLLGITAGLLGASA
ncbi:NADH-quinone oxidoreductase subunit N [Isoptericola sp. b408]|uniref:NADH-quinone oxidoreductase subunit N n=1 Tax=Isoptericola sp. b408 TaxID=3064653 RepID=UPI002712EAB2|nr:proton-conducting transporter membrane subunit [Isoptericola sp. b408]MDO8152588.1 proton-conducting transporter membrane subunit [Isoptericola sp. b408]